MKNFTATPNSRQICKECLHSFSWTRANCPRCVSSGPRAGFGRGLVPEIGFAGEPTGRFFASLSIAPQGSIWDLPEGQEAGPAPRWIVEGRDSPKKKSRRRDWKPLPQGEQVAAPGLLCFIAPSRAIESGRVRPPPPTAPFVERAVWAAQNGWRFLNIAGLAMPAINGSFLPYERLEGERLKAWKGRLFRMRRTANYAKKLQKLWDRLDETPAEQIHRISQSIGRSKNMFSSLKEECLVGPSLAEMQEHEHFQRSVMWQQRFAGSVAIRSQFPRGTFVNCGPKPFNRVTAYQEVRLAAKNRLAWFAEDWRAVRAVRRERMGRVYVRDPIAHKSATLRKVLINLAERIYKEEKPSKFIDMLSASGEMEVEGASAHGDSSAKVEKTSNVEVQQQTGTSVGASLPSTSKDSYRQLSAAKSEVADRTLHDRWFTLKSFDWAGSDAQGAKILDLNIPKDIFDAPNFRNSPNYAMISRHAYWRGNLEIKIFTNTNVRQFGQIQYSFYYGSKQDKNFDALRCNIYSASQRMHALMTANTSNEVILKIPFEYIFPIMAINCLPKVEDIKHLGCLQGLVVVPLTAVEGCPNTVSVKVMIRMLENEFSGMIGTSIAKAEMLSLASIIAVKSLLDKNRDSPTVVTPGVPVIPINSSSWCYGTGQSTFNNVLRLNPNAVLPYEEGRIPNLDEMTVDFIKKTFGMIKILEWTKNTTVGEGLFSWDAAPISDMTEYPNIIVGKRSMSIVPPVAVLSSMFAYWRGSLKLRIDIVGATEISGSLLICYVPRLQKEDTITMDQAFTLPHTIYDIHENRQIEFEIPFVASHMFWPRRSTLSLDYPIYRAPGCVHVFCYNKLVVNCAIPDSCKLVIYLSAGSDFEVAVPACPSFGLSFNSQVFVPPSTERRVTPIEGYVPAYSGSWREAYMLLNSNQAIMYAKDFIVCGAQNVKDQGTTIPRADTYYFVPILRYGEVSDHVTQFIVSGIETLPKHKNWNEAFVIGKFSDLSASLMKLRWSPVSSGDSIDQEYNCTHAICFEEEGYIYALPMTAQQAVKAELFAGKMTSTTNIVNSHSVYELWIASYVEVWPNYQPNSQKSWHLFYNSLNSISTPWWQPDTFYLTIVYPNIPSSSAEAGDEKSALEAPPSQPQSTAKATNASKCVFGEQFLDLKDYCRRFQLYASDSLVLEKLTDTKKWRSISIRFPVLPQGLELDLGSAAEPNEYWNRTREGPIPLIASGYRFFTGGIRFRICVNVTEQISFQRQDIRGKLFVQHRPNIISKRRRVIVQSGTTLGTDDIELPGYASYHQVDDVNNVLSVEVPFYVPTIRTYLQEPSGVPTALRYSNLGELAIGVTLYSYEKLNFTYDIYYSLADDARFSVFVGFPPVFDITKIPNLIPPKSLFNVNNNKISNAIEDLKDVEASNSEPEMVEIPKSKMSEATELYEKYKDLEKNKALVMRVQSSILKGEYDGAIDIMKRKISSASGQMGLGDMIKNFTTTSEKANETLEKVSELVTDENITEFKETCSTFKNFAEKLKDVNIKESCTGLLENIELKFHKYVDLVINAVSNLIHCLISNFHPASVITAIGSFFLQCKLFSITYLEKFYECLTGLFSFWTRSQIQSTDENAASAQMALQNPKGDKEEEEKVIAAYVSTLIAGIAACFSFVPKISKAGKDEIAGLLMKGLTTFTYTANHLFTFIRNNLIAAKKIFEWISNDHPSVKKLGVLRNSNESLYEWARESLELTNPRNQTKVMTSPRLATNVYEKAAQADLLMIDLCRLKIDAQEVKVLEYISKRLHDIRDRLAKTHLAPPVRFEPYVYELTGKTGIGKSELFKILPYTIFKYCNLTHEGELIYHRAIGNAYWNNLQNQPVLTVDEKFPVNAPGFLDVQLAELFQLKSSCIFNPPMADIPDKNIRYNPILCQYGSNCPFPDLPQALDKKAVYRRRDALIQVAMNEAMINKYGVDCKYEHLSEKDRKYGGGLETGKPKPFAFLRFRFHRDVCTASVSDNMWTNWMTYDVFVNTICQKFQNFMYTEEKKYREALHRMKSIMPRQDESREISDIFKYDWLQKLDEITPKNSESVFIEELKEKYQEAFTFSNKRDQIFLKMHISFKELCGASAEEINPLLNKLFDLQKKEADANPAVQHHKRVVQATKDFYEKHALTSEELDIIQRNQCLIAAQRRQDLADAKAAQMGASTSASGDMAADDMPAFAYNREYGCVHKMLSQILRRSEVKFMAQGQEFRFPQDSDQCKEEIAHLIFETKSKQSIVNTMNELPAVTYVLDEICKTDVPLRRDNSFYYLKFTPCNESDCCLLRYEDQHEYITTYWLSNLTTATLWANAENVYDFMPATFLASACGLRNEACLKEYAEAVEKTFKLKSWLKQVKDNIMGIDWKKWFKRLSIVIAIFSFLGLIFGLWKHTFTDSEQKSSSSGSCSTSLANACGFGSIAVSSASLAAKLSTDAGKQNSTDGSTIVNAFANGHVSGDYSVGKGAKKISRPAIKMVEHLAGQSSGQMGFGVKNEDAVTSAILRNSVFLSLHNDKMCNIGRCIGICDRHVLVVDHFYEAWTNVSQREGLTDMLAVFARDGRLSPIPLKFSELKYSKITDSNLGILTLPKRFPPFKDIRKFIAKKSTHSNLNFRGKAMELNLDQKNLGTVVLHSHNLNFENYYNLHVHEGRLWKSFDVHDGYKYEGFHGAGKCGSILLGHGIERPIIGIHIAGFDYMSAGVSEFIYSEMFDVLGSVVDPHDASGEGVESRWFVDSHVIGVGKVPAMFAHQERGKSRIVASELQLKDKGENFSIFTQPAVLSKGDKRIRDAPFSPMTEGCRHHGKPLLAFPEEILKVAIEDYQDLVLAKCKPMRKPGLLSVEEAIGGLDGKPGYEHLEFDTSEGFPFVGFRPSYAKNKRWLFNFDDMNHYESHNDLLDSVLRHKWQQRIDGIIPCTVFTDCLKDCTIEHAKVLEPGKTRIFSMSPVDFSIQQRQCTLDFSVAFMANRRELEHMIGCNPDSVEWTWLAQDLLTRGSAIMTGDYSKYGDTIPFEFIEAAFQIILNWYKFHGCVDEELFAQLKIFPYEIGHAYHLMFDHIYQCVCGQPSGNSLTVIINSIANSLYLRCAWLSLMRGTEYCTLASMHKHIQIFSYGDDLIVSLSDEVKDLFNAKSLHQFFASIGLKFTNANKGEEMIAHETLEKAEFLKRGFIMHPMRRFPQLMLGPLKRESIEETPNWVWSESFDRSDPQSMTFREMSMQVCADSVRNAYGRGPAYHEEWRNKIRNFWLNQGVHIKLDTWEQMDHKIFNLKLNLNPYNKWLGIYPVDTLKK